MWVSCVPYPLEEKTDCMLLSKYNSKGTWKFKQLTLWWFLFSFCSLQGGFTQGKIIHCKIFRAGVEVTCRSFMLSAQAVCAYAECGIFNCRLAWELASFEVFLVWFVFWIFFFFFFTASQQNIKMTILKQQKGFYS